LLKNLTKMKNSLRSLPDIVVYLLKHIALFGLDNSYEFTTFDFQL